MGFLSVVFLLLFFFFFLKKEVDDSKVWKVKQYIKEDKAGLLDPATL